MKQDEITKKRKAETEDSAEYVHSALREIKPNGYLVLQILIWTRIRPLRQLLFQKRS